MLVIKMQNRRDALLVAYSISFLDFVNFDDEMLSRDRLVLDKKAD
jgi:hypothetical protein